MPVPDPVAGTKPPRHHQPGRGDNKNPPTNKHGPKASSPGDGKGKGGKKKGAVRFDTEPLNPPFDPRMRKIGSPLNMTNKIKRGWIQREDNGLRVDFLFNPSELSLTHATFDMSRSTKDKPANEPSDWDPAYPTVGSSTGVKLLYDRTYEMFSLPKAGKANFANQYGVWADVAAWYTFLGMLPEMPTDWESSIIVEPPKYFLAYLFVGSKMVFYGWVTGIDVVYSHWNQNMVPVRCAVDVAFQILPYTKGDFAMNAAKNWFANIDPLAGWGSSEGGGSTDAPVPVIPNSPTQMPGP